MIKIKTILHILGILLAIEGLFILLTLPFSFYYGGSDSFALLISAFSAIFCGGVAWFLTRRTDKNIGKREGYVIVTFSWIIISIFGSLPFYIHGSIPSYTDAFFETMSGFTTTGASILSNIEALPKGLLFWRSTTQWIGGMGIIVFSLAILPMLGIGGMQLFMAEVPGPNPDKLHPKIKETAKRLWGIYILFTALQTILLLFGGLDFFDSINHTFATISSGGYSTKNTSIAYYDSAYIQYVIIFFMFLAGTNFTLSYFALNARFKKIWKNEEFQAYILIIIIFTLLITFGLAFRNYAPSENEFCWSFSLFEKCFRDSLFQVVSIITTTGFATADYELWQPILIALLFALMFFGGSAGSTGGGIKIVRIVIVLKNSFLEFKRLLHPKAIIPVRINRHVVKPDIVANINSFIVLYILLYLFGVLILAFLGHDLETSLGSVAATFGNIGPGIGDVGPTENFADLHTAGKWVLWFFMLAGRLELFTVLILLSPAFWKR